MAIAFQVVYSYLDDSGKTGTQAIDIPITFSLAQYTEFGRAMAALIDEIVHGVVSSAALTVNVDISGLTSNTLVADSDVEEIGSFQFSTADNRRVLINVPAFDESKVLAGSDNLDISDTDVAAFIAAIENGVAVTGGTIIPSDVEDIGNLELSAARELFRSSGSRR
jgi:hypothetical protein